MSSSKIVLITGASSGIGEATAKTLVKNGHKVILTARSKDKLDYLVTELGSEHALAVPADATHYQELQTVVAKGVEYFGHLNAVFANAGTGANSPGVENGEPSEWNTMIDVNVNALIYTAKASLKELRKTTGHFLITSSIAGKRPIKGSIYGATKWFAYGFGMNLAEEMSEWNGRCTTICPGMVNTPFFAEAKPEKLDPSDVADAVLFALSADPRCDIREVCLMPTK
jgi:hypothetical protein